MIGWPQFALVLAAFFITHTVPVRPPVKARLTRILGASGFTAAYSALSLFMLGLVITAAGRAPYVQLWPQSDWQIHVAGLGMFAVCLIICLTLGRPNPFSFGGARNAEFNPARAGIVRYIRHPLLAALALWAGVHLLPNGDLAHVIMFGIFLGFALLGRLIIDRRNQRLMGAAVWRARVGEIKSAPLLARPITWSGSAMRLCAAVILFALLLGLHPIVFGVSPLAW